MTLAKAEQTVCTLCVVNDFLFTQDRLSLKSERDMIPLLKQAIVGVEQARKCHLICVVDIGLRLPTLELEII